MGLVRSVLCPELTHKPHSGSPVNMYNLNYKLYALSNNPGRSTAPFVTIFLVTRLITADPVRMLCLTSLLYEGWPDPAMRPWPGPIVSAPGGGYCKQSLKTFAEVVEVRTACPECGSPHPGTADVVTIANGGLTGAERASSARLCWLRAGSCPLAPATRLHLRPPAHRRLRRLRPSRSRPAIPVRSPGHTRRRSVQRCARS